MCITENKDIMLTIGQRFKAQTHLTHMRHASYKSWIFQLQWHLLTSILHGTLKLGTSSSVESVYVGFSHLGSVRVWTIEQKIAHTFNQCSITDAESFVAMSRILTSNELSLDAFPSVLYKLTKLQNLWETLPPLHVLSTTVTNTSDMLETLV